MANTIKTPNISVPNANTEYATQATSGVTWEDAVTWEGAWAWEGDSPLTRNIGKPRI